MNLSKKEIEHLFCSSESGIIEMDEMLDKIVEMKKRIQQIKQIKEMHPYEIHSTEKSGWFTSVDDPTQPNGKRKIRRANEDSFWNAMIDWYINSTDKNISFKQLFDKWIKWKTTPNNEANIQRIMASWKAYYLDEPLSKKLLETPVSQITSLMLREWAEELMKIHQPDKKKFSRMFTIVNQCFEYASDEDIAIVTKNTWQKARKKLNKSLTKQNVTPADDTQVFTDEERRQIQQMVHSDLIKYKKQSSSAGLQILFLFETGLRIGECCGLKWSDVKNKRLYVHRQADNNRVKETTKTCSSYRDIPLTKEAQRILEEVKKFNLEHGYRAEWIFQSNNPEYDYRLSYNAADRKLRKLCARLDSEMRSPHKCRKTCISTLLDSPVNSRTVQRFAGHQDISTTYTFYNYERKSKKEQAEAIDAALAV